MKKIKPAIIIENKIYLIRERKVMLDRDLAEIYGVATMRLNERVKRNISRFPRDFMFQLTKQERDEVIANCDNLQSLKYSPALPYAFTEQGVAMLSSVLNSPRAIEMNIYIIRAFIQMRELIAIDRDLELGIFLLRTEQKRQGIEIDEIIERLNQLTDEPLKTPGPLGFSLN
jgi:hypothetical protein